MSLRIFMWKTTPVRRLKKKEKKNAFQFPPPKKFIAAESNPVEIIGCDKEMMYLLRCCVCFKFSSQAVFECEEKGHVVCHLCYQLINLDDCPYENGEKCLSVMKRREATIPSVYLRGLKFPCINPVCKEVVGGGDAWKMHMEECKFRNVMRCPDSSCGAIGPRGSLFRQHCKKEHEIELVHDDTFWFTLPVSTKFGAPKTWILTMVKPSDNNDLIVYFVGQHDSDGYFSFSCFTLSGEAEEAEGFAVEVNVESSLNSDLQMRTLMRVNSKHQDLEDVKQFGRSVYICYPEFKEIFEQDHVTMSEYERSHYVINCSIQDASSSLLTTDFFPKWTAMDNSALVSNWVALSPEEMEKLEKFEKPTQPVASTSIQPSANSISAEFSDEIASLANGKFNVPFQINSSGLENYEPLGEFQFQCKDMSVYKNYVKKKFSVGKNIQYIPDFTVRLFESDESFKVYAVEASNYAVTYKKGTGAENVREEMLGTYVHDFGPHRQAL